MSIPKLRINNHMSQTEQQLADTINNIIETIDTSKVTTDGDKELSDNNLTDELAEQIPIGIQTLTITDNILAISNGNEVELPPATKGEAWETTLPTNPTVGVEYPYKGVTNTLIGEITWYSGDNAQWNGTIWKRIPYQTIPISKAIDDLATTAAGSELKAYTNKGEVEQYCYSFMSKSVNLFDISKIIVGSYINTNTGANSTGGTTNCADYFKLIKPSTLYGVNTTCKLHWYTKDLVWISCTDHPWITSDYVPMEVTSPSNAKYCRTIVAYATVGLQHMMVEGGIVAIPTLYTPYERWISSSIVKDDDNYELKINKNNQFYNANFGLDHNATVTLVLSAIKDIKLYGNWDTSKYYRIRSIARNNATSKDELWITEVDVNGTTTGYAYQTANVNVAETISSTKPTLVTFAPWSVNGRYIVALIDYRLLTEGERYNIDVRNNFLIRPTNIIPDEVLSVPTDEVTFADVDYLTLPASPKNKYENNTVIPANLMSNNKKGIVYLRIDDNGVNETFDATLERFGFRGSYSINTSATKLNVPYHLQNQRRGHDYGCHTPEHNTNWFTIPPGYEDLFATFEGNGLDSIVGTKAFLTKQYFVDGVDRNIVTDAATELSTIKIGGTAYSLEAGSNRIYGDFSTLVGHKYYHLYIDNAIGDKIGWVMVDTTKVYSNRIYIQTMDAIDLLVPNTETVNMYAIATGGSMVVTMSTQSSYVLMLAGYIWFQLQGFTPPKYWSQCGGNWAYLNATNSIPAAKKLGYKHITVFGGTALPTYNMEIVNKEATTLYYDLSLLSYSDLAVTKQTIAYKVATHTTVGMLIHHDIAAANFGTADGYTTTADRIYQCNKFIYELCQWLFDTGIYIHSLTETQAILNESTTNPYINIIPNFYTDLAVQSKPDGHTLGTGTTWVLDDGVPEDKLHCLKRTTASTDDAFTTISNLGGLEKGENQCGVWVKGSIGDTVTIWWGGIKTSTFLVDSEGWNKFTDTLIIPYTTNFMTIVIKGTIIDSDCRISGIYLHK